MNRQRSLHPPLKKNLNKHSAKTHSSMEDSGVYVAMNLSRWIIARDSEMVLTGIDMVPCPLSFGRSRCKIHEALSRHLGLYDQQSSMMLIYCCIA